jgi:ferredoxin
VVPFKSHRRLNYLRIILKTVTFLVTKAIKFMSKKIVFCNCGGKNIGTERLMRLDNLVLNTDAEVIKVSDLCGLTVFDKDSVGRIFSSTNEVLLLACYPRTINLILQNAGIHPDHAHYQLLNTRELNDEQIFNEIESFCEGGAGEHSYTEIKGEAEWPAWYPVIDPKRCSSCGQCANFCLFGVYEINEDKVRVVNSKGCKNNCPACARICPQSAIIFPKYQQGGAIGGSDLIDEVAEQQRQAQDISTILGSDIYAALEQRKAKRQSIIRNEAMKKALAEREKALAEEGKEK